MYLPPQFNLRTGQLETDLDIPRRHVFDEIVAHTLAAMPLCPTLPMPAEDNGYLTFSAPSAEARWIAELVGDLVVGEEIDATTDHAWLVVIGYLGQALGLIAELEKVPIRQRKGPKCKPQTKLIELLVGILGGIIWSIGMSLSIIASGKAGPSISYGLGQGATMVAAFWGVFIWKEFKDAPAGTNRLLALMFVFYMVGLALIVYAGNV